MCALSKSVFPDIVLDVRRMSFHCAGIEINNRNHFDDTEIEGVFQANVFPRFCAFGMENISNLTPTNFISV